MIVKVKIKKIKELPDALYPNNIEVGFESVCEISLKNFKYPTVGKHFIHRGIITSPIRKILTKNMFKTVNSIYEWSFVKK